MDKKQAIDVLKYRLTLLKNYDKIINSLKSSRKADLSGQGQLDMFSVGLEDPKENTKLVEYDGNVAHMDIVDIEKDLLGLTISYNPLDELIMYEDLYCTHKVTDLFSMNKTKHNIVIMDYIVNIDYKKSKKNNFYAQIQISNFNDKYFMYLFGDTFKENIHKLFIGESFLIQLSYQEPTPKFDRDSYVINSIKNIKDVEIDEEYNRIINNLKITSELKEDWMIKNKK